MVRFLLLFLSSAAMGSSVDRSGVDLVVKRHLEQLRYCYEKRLPQRPELEGRVVMRLVLTRDGALTSVGIDGSSTLDDAPVEDCLLARFGEWTWPPGPWDHDILYPLTFTQDALPPVAPAPSLPSLSAPDPDPASTAAGEAGQGVDRRWPCIRPPRGRTRRNR